jgi:PIN domain nuclease of toxin-antitoxin system
VGIGDVIVLDTHAWVWWLTKPERLGRRAARAIEKTDRIGVSAISVWEIAAKEDAGSLRFDRPVDVWLDAALTEDPRIELLHLSPRISVDAVRLAWPHRDPADRFIVATARKHEAPLVTADERIIESALVRCLWD